MIESSCPACGSKVLLPDPPPKSREEISKFAKAWDAKVKAALEKGFGF